jgi:hypothetical protein
VFGRFVSISSGYAGLWEATCGADDLPATASRLSAHLTYNGTFLLTCGKPGLRSYNVAVCVKRGDECLSCTRGKGVKVADPFLP